MATSDGRPVLLTRRELNQMHDTIRDMLDRIEQLESGGQVLHGEDYRAYLRHQERARKRKARDTNGSRRY